MAQPRFHNIEALPPERRQELIDRYREEHLPRVAAGVRNAERQLEFAREARDAIVVQASALGLSRREVAELACVTVGRVQQVIDAYGWSNLDDPLFAHDAV
jgi:hypothetical protein